MQLVGEVRIKTARAIQRVQGLVISDSPRLLGGDLLHAPAQAGELAALPVREGGLLGIEAKRPALTHPPVLRIPLLPGFDQGITLLRQCFIGGTAGQAHAGPEALQLTQGAVVVVQFAVAVIQVTGTDLEPDIATRFDLIQPEVATHFLQVDITHGVRPQQALGAVARINAQCIASGTNAAVAGGQVKGLARHHHPGLAENVPLSTERKVITAGTQACQVDAAIEGLEVDRAELAGSAQAAGGLDPQGLFGAAD